MEKKEKLHLTIIKYTDSAYDINKVIASIEKSNPNLKYKAIYLAMTDIVYVPAVTSMTYNFTYWDKPLGNKK